MTASNTAFTVFSAISLILSLIPLRWHLESWNVGTCAFMIWTALTCFVFFVDSIVWNGNTTDWAPVWCDISVRIQIASAVAWPACALCITRRLHNITSSTTISSSHTHTRREFIVDLLIAVGIPVLEMGLEYIVAAHRFKIVEDFGCSPATWNTPLTYVLVWSWPLIIGIVSAYYGALTIHAFVRKRRQFKDLISANATLTLSRYWRLIAMASIDFCLTIPLAITAIITNAVAGPRPWVSWADTHSEFSQIIQVSRSDQDTATRCSHEFTRWAAIFCALLFFGFFGFADEAMKNYRLLVSTIAKCLGYTALPGFSVKSGTGSVAGASLSVFVTHETESKDGMIPDRDSTATIIAATSPDHEVPRVKETVPDSALVPAPSY